MPAQTREGTLDFDYPTLPSPAKTWYRIYGNLDSNDPSIVPLVALHGGPGVTHNYLLSLTDLTEDASSGKPGIPIVLYDQVGNGLSTHYPEKMNDGDFWTVNLWIAELENLLEKLGISRRFDILGHSWGGMLGAEFAIRQPAGLRRLIISDSPADMEMWEESTNKLRAMLPTEVQDVLTACEQEGRTDSEEFEKANMEFMSRFVCRLNPWPQELLDSLDWGLKKDPTVYLTTLGPSEFLVIGSFKGWSILDSLHKIKTPTLLINGRHDEAQDFVVAPFFQKLEKVKWVTFADSSHSPHWEERERYMQVVGDFLRAKD